jgi:hypothetical protein
MSRVRVRISVWLCRIGRISGNDTVPIAAAAIAAVPEQHRNSSDSKDNSYSHSTPSHLSLVMPDNPDSSKRARGVKAPPSSPLPLSLPLSNEPLSSYKPYKPPLYEPLEYTPFGLVCGPLKLPQLS